MACPRTSQSFVRKKAALTLLRLYRKHPEVIPAAEWALRIVSLMDDMDLVCITKSHDCDVLINAQGVVICVTSLVMALAQDHLDAYAVCYQKAADRLQRVSQREGVASLSVFIHITPFFQACCGTRILCDIRVLQSTIAMASG